jgi:hypothetical protein
MRRFDPKETSAKRRDHLQDYYLLMEGGAKVMDRCA